MITRPCKLMDFQYISKYAFILFDLIRRQSFKACQNSSLTIYLWWQQKVMLQNYFNFFRVNMKLLCFTQLNLPQYQHFEKIKVGRHNPQFTNSILCTFLLVFLCSTPNISFLFQVYVWKGDKKEKAFIWLENSCSPLPTQCCFES